MITQTENEKLYEYIRMYRAMIFEFCENGRKDNTELRNKWNDLKNFIESITENPKTYYAVNLNPVGYLPESEPYEGLENVDEIMDAIDSICYLFEDSEGIDANEELPEKRHTREMLTKLIEQNKLEHETIGYLGNFCIFVYKDDEYEYRQSK